MPAHSHSASPLLHSLRPFRRTEILIPPLRGCANQIAARFDAMLRLQHGVEGGIGGPVVRYFAFALRAPLLHPLRSFRRTEVLSPPLRGCANQIAARFVAMLRLQHGGEGGIGGPVVRYFAFALRAPLLHSLRSFRRTEVLSLPLGAAPIKSLRASTPCCECNMAEREGFEPPEPCGSAVFKTAAIDHSATSPVAGALRFGSSRRCRELLIAGANPFSLRLRKTPSVLSLK